VTVQELQPKIIVLDVEAPAQSARVLMDEAEHARVRTRRDVAWSWRHQLHAEVAALPLHEDAPGAAVALHREPQPIVGRVELKVDGIAERCAVDRLDPVAGAKPGRRSQRAPPDGRDDDAGGAVGSRGAGATH